MTLFLLFKLDCIGRVYLFLVQVWLRQKYHASQVRPKRAANPWPPDKYSIFHILETLRRLTTEPSGPHCYLCKVLNNDDFRQLIHLSLSLPPSPPSLPPMCSTLTHTFNALCPRKSIKLMCGKSLSPALPLPLKTPGEKWKKKRKETVLLSITRETQCTRRI